MIQPSRAQVDRLVLGADVTRAQAEQIVGDGTQALGLIETLPEDFFIIRQRICEIQLLVAAGGAGFRSQVQLWNPTTVQSPTLLIVQRFSVFEAGSAATRTCTLRHDVAARTLQSQGLTRDTRWMTEGAVSVAATGELRFSNGAAVTGVAFASLAAVAGGTAEFVPPEIVIGPQRGVSGDMGVDNSSVQCTIAWREFDLRVR